MWNGLGTMDIALAVDGLRHHGRCHRRRLPLVGRRRRCAAASPSRTTCAVTTRRGSRCGFWAYDQSIEVPFFIGADVLGALQPATAGSAPTAALRRSMPSWARIRTVAAKVYGLGLVAAAPTISAPAISRTSADVETLVRGRPAPRPGAAPRAQGGAEPRRRGNRETKKPKQDKPKPAAAASPFAAQGRRRPAGVCAGQEETAADVECGTSARRATSISKRVLEP